MFDVTLVSDDEQHIAAHKLVLSASSEFFKNIIKKAKHSNPMIYLSGFKSKDLYLVMDYIYQGEVQILQTDLDGFLNVAQQLKIEGLIGGDNDSVGTNSDEYIKEDVETSHTQEETILDNVEDNDKYNAPKKRIPKADRSVAVVSSASNVEAKVAVDDLVEKTENGYMCKACGKISTSKTSSDIRSHAEIHIEGLSFDCQLCDKTFRSRGLLNHHKVDYHRK